MPVDDALGIESHVVGNGGEVVGSLRVDVAVGDDPLAALLEVQKRLPQLLKHGRAVTDEVRTNLKIDAHDLVVVGSSGNGSFQLVEAERRVEVAHCEAEGVGSISAFQQFAAEIDAQHRAFFDRCCRRFAGTHADDADEAYHECQHDE